jgi:DNA-binding NarL/FixJ family response regulator
VVILTLSEDIAYQKAAEEAGADGFIPKTEFANRVMPLLTRIMMLS